MSTPNPSGSFVPIRGVGDHLSTGGRHFDFTRFDQGRIVKRIGVHFNPSTCLRGISISYENGDTRTTGALQNSYNEITLEPGETIRRASLRENGRGTRTGRIRLETDRGITFNAGRNTTGQDEFPVHVGSRILAGFVGRSDADILILGFVFILPVRRTEISNSRYKLPSGSSIVPHYLANQATFTKNGSSVNTCDFFNSVERTNSVTFSSSVTLEFGGSISVSDSIPAIVFVESGFSWGGRHDPDVNAHQTNETTKTFSWSLGGTLEPGEELTCTATCQYGSADLEYTADVRHVFNDGQNLRYVDHGTLENAKYGFAEVASRTGRNGHMVLELQESKNADAVAALGDSGIKPRL